MEPSPDFDWARRNEPALNPRQRDVLRLLANGKTNAQIGELLGITLDGAKWNVSEILTKLGLRTREEAAAYWHWRNRPAARVSRLVRGAAGLPGLKLVLGGGAAGLAAVAVVAVVLFASRGTEDEARVLGTGPFTLEATLRVDQEDGSVAVSDLTWRYADPAHWAWTIENHDDGRVASGVGDGTAMWTYSSVDGTYTRMPLPTADRPWPPPISLFVGPAGSLGQSAEEVRQGFLLTAGPDGTFRDEGSGRVLGVACRQWVFAPAWRSSYADSTGATRDASGGETRICIDLASLVILRYETDLEGGRGAEAEITSWADRVDPAVGFAFVPPPGSRENTP